MPLSCGSARILLGLKRDRRTTKQLRDRYLDVHGEGQQAQYFTAVRSYGRRADEHTAVGILNQFDQSFVSGVMDPAARRARDSRQADADAKAGPEGCLPR